MGPPGANARRRGWLPPAARHPGRVAEPPDQLEAEREHLVAVRGHHLADAAVGHLTCHAGAVVGDDADGGVAHVQLARQRRLRHDGHADGLRAEHAQHADLRCRLKARPLRAGVDHAPGVGQPMLEDERFERVVERGGKDLLHARVQPQPVLALEGGGTGFGKVDEVRQQAQAAELVRIIARADGRDAHHVRHAQAVQRVDVRPVVDLAGIEAVEHAVAREKDELMVVQVRAEHDHVSIGRGDGLLKVGDGQRFDVRSADDAEFHGWFLPRGR